LLFARMTVDLFLYGVNMFSQKTVKLRVFQLNRLNR
jgi:hypothetical protein